ncbi:MAG: MFS transporter [Candidatus Binatia bacterium]|nr:MFS transporter [Candidatus Binatia bacterium]
MTSSETSFPASKIFFLSSAALFTAGLSFSLRGAIAGGIETEVLSKIDPANSGMLTGQVLGIAFTGFAITLFLGSVFLDRLGMGRSLILASLSFTTGTLVAVFSDRLGGESGSYTFLWLGYLLSGLGWGFVEAATNPLITALYPEDKTHRLNVLHAWWPAGVLVGGVTGGAFGAIGWRMQFALVVIPAIVVGVLCIGTPFPRTERAARGVAWADMWREIPRRPMFLVWLACMFLTAASELAPGQWIDFTLTRTVGMRGIWLLVYVSLMMFVFRHFAGTVVHRLGSPIALLTWSVALSALGLMLLPRATSPVMGLLAATVWGLGVCFLWPTMLANVSERYPRGGELFIGLMGVAGAMAIQFVLPALGAIFDRAKVDLAGSDDTFAALQGDELQEVLSQAALVSFETNAILPAILIFVFGAIWIYDRAHGGYHPEKLEDEGR